MRRSPTTCSTSNTSPAPGRAGGDRPDGKPLQAVNAATGKYRSTFDVQLSQPGTYKIVAVNNGVFASYKIDGQQKRWRGSAEALAKEIPANATELKVTQMNSRVETFVTPASRPRPPGADRHWPGAPR
jgi:hypothetical protein